MLRLVAIGLLYFAVYPPHVRHLGSWVVLLLFWGLSFALAPWFITVVFSIVMLRIMQCSRGLRGVLASVTQTMPAQVEPRNEKFRDGPLARANGMEFELQFVRDQLSVPPLGPAPALYTRRLVS